MHPANRSSAFPIFELLGRRDQWLTDQESIKGGCPVSGWKIVVDGFVIDLITIKSANGKNICG